MNPFNFEDYWRNFGKFEHEVIKNCSPNRELEEDFRNLAEKVWKSLEKNAEDEYQRGYSNGQDDALYDCSCRS